MRSLAGHLPLLSSVWGRFVGLYVRVLWPVALAPGMVIQWEAEMLKQPFGEVLRLERAKGMAG